MRDPNAQLPLRVALVVASYAGSLPPSTSHRMTDDYLPWLVRRPGNKRMQIYLYVACDVAEADNATLIPTRARLAKRPSPQNNFFWPARCQLQPRAVTVLQPHCAASSRHSGAQCSIEYVANIGREAHMYLHHLLRVYAAPDLADMTIFVQEGEPWGLEYLFECAGGLHNHSHMGLSECATTDFGPYGAHDLYFGSPLGGVCNSSCRKRTLATPDVMGKLDDLLRACGLASDAPLDDRVPSCDADDASLNSTQPRASTRGPRAAVRFAQALVRHLNRVCPLVGSLVTSREGWLMPGRGTFAVSRAAIRYPPYALYAELYALSSSSEVEIEPFRTIPPCDRRCHGVRARPSIKCPSPFLAGDSVAYFLEGLWAVVFGAMRASEEAGGVRSTCVRFGNSSRERDLAMANGSLIRPWGSLALRGGVWCGEPA